MAVLQHTGNVFRKIRLSSMALQAELSNMEGHAGAGFLPGSELHEYRSPIASV